MAIKTDCDIEDDRLAAMFREFTQQNVSPLLGGNRWYSLSTFSLVAAYKADNGYVLYVIVPVHNECLISGNIDLKYSKCFKESKLCS